ncbi:MAG: hypothetical protein L0215_15165 [Gemmataceae bacterium]|nr:hypothetical protein [Gemmataceae bacterium]
MKRRHEEPRRVRDARGDAHVEAIEKKIEKAFGLPNGSVQINNPSGGDARGDKLIENLHKDFDKRDES